MSPNLTNEDLVRVQILMIAPEYIVDLMGLSSHSTEFMGLPLGVKVVRTDYDWMTDRIRVAISHPDFDVVPLGQMPPMFSVGMFRTSKGNMQLQKTQEAR